MDEATPIGNIKMGDRNLNFTGTVKEVREARTFNKFGKEGKVQEVIVGDDSGSAVLVLWNEMAETLKEGDKVNVTGAYTKEFRGEIQLHIPRQGTMEKAE